jgi:O-antigen/teichoic acid export membrane protein
MFANTLTNGVSSVINAVITVILTPILITQLGSENYGLWSLLLSASYTYGYLAIGDLGLGEFMLRSVPAAIIGVPEHERKLASITSNSLAASVVGGLSSIALALCFVTVISNLGLSSSFTSNLVLLCVFFILCEAIFEIICSVFRGYIEGQGRFRVARTIDTSGRIIWGISASVLLFNGGGLVQLAITTAVISLFRLSLYIFFSHFVSHPIVLSWRLVNRAGVVSVIRGGLHLNGLKVLYSIYSQMDRSIIAVFLSVSAITTYDISFRFFSVAVLLLATSSSAIIPVISKQHSQGESAANKTVLLRGTSLTVAVTVPICLGMMFYAPSIIEVWIGPGHLDAVAPARIFLIFPLLSSANQIGIAMLTAVGLTKKVLKYQSILVLINLGLSIIFVQLWGVKGVVLGTLVSHGVLWIPYTKLILTTFDTSVLEWTKVIIPPFLLAILIQGSFFVAFHHLFESSHTYASVIFGLTTVMTVTITLISAYRDNFPLTRG